jgi:hypothetical protein
MVLSMSVLKSNPVLVYESDEMIDFDNPTEEQQKILDEFGAKICEKTKALIDELIIMGLDYKINDVEGMKTFALFTMRDFLIMHVMEAKKSPRHGMAFALAPIYHLLNTLVSTLVEAIEERSEHIMDISFTLKEALEEMDSISLSTKAKAGKLIGKLNEAIKDGLSSKCENIEDVITH